MREKRDDEFTDFVVEHGPRLLRTACLLTGDGHLGEDLMQTSLAKVYGSWARVSAADHPAAYVRRLMVDAQLSWLRRLTNTERVVETFPDRGTEDFSAAHAETDRMRTALLSLSPRVRTAVVLRFVDDLSQAETARLLGCSRSTVNYHVTRGLTGLRAQLGADRRDDRTPMSRSHQ